MSRWKIFPANNSSGLDHVDYRYQLLDRGRLSAGIGQDSLETEEAERLDAVLLYQTTGRSNAGVLFRRPEAALSVFADPDPVADGHANRRGRKCQDD